MFLDKTFERYKSIGANSHDSQQLLISKKMLALVSLLVGFAATVWGITFLYFNHFLAATINFSYTLLCIIGVSHFALTKKIFLVKNLQIYGLLLLPFFTMWSLGGFSGGGFSLIWSFYAIIISMLFKDKKTTRLFVLFTCLVVLSVLIDSTVIKHAVFLPDFWIKILFALNAFMGLGGIYYIFLHYNSGLDDNSKVALQIERDKLFNQKHELKKLNVKLSELATHDTLTGLFNRYALLNQLNEITDSTSSEKEFSLLFIDLDRFKIINDSLGHKIGDQMLIHVAKILRQQLAPKYFISRLGGDEFIVIIDHFKDNESVCKLAENLIKMISKLIIIEEHELQITCSIGITFFPNDIETDNEVNSGGNLESILISNADVAMYHAKREGKNKYKLYETSMTSDALEIMVLEQELRHALVNNELVVYYQSQVDMQSGTIIGMEALVRWNHPSKGMIPPFKFIPLAEDVGLIVLLDRIVMAKAMKQFSIWQKQGLRPGSLSLNLSVKQLQQDDFIEKVLSIMKEYNFIAAWLELEVTESQIMDNPKQSIDTLCKLEAMGIKLSIDDFGTGYSSLAYLKHLPIQKLKIDQSFIKGTPEDKDDVIIVNSIINLSTSLGLDVIAEGVERKEQRDFLLEHGCAHAQGYYYAKPVKAEDMEKMLIDALASNEKINVNSIVNS